MNKEIDQRMKIEKLENHLRHWMRVAETEETKVRKLQELNRQLQISTEGYRSNWIKSSDNVIELKKEIEQWKELFFLLKKDHESLEKYETNEWITKAREMSIDV